MKIKINSERTISVKKNSNLWHFILAVLILYAGNQVFAMPKAPTPTSTSVPGSSKEKGSKQAGSSKTYDQKNSDDAAVKVLDANGNEYHIYLLNLYGVTVSYFENSDLKEKDLVDQVVGDRYWDFLKENQFEQFKDFKAAGEYKIPAPFHPSAHFLQPTDNKSWEERMSTQGVVLVRIFSKGDPVPISQAVSALGLQMTIGKASTTESKTPTYIISGADDSSVEEESYSVSYPFHNLIDGPDVPSTPLGAGDSILVNVITNPPSKGSSNQKSFNRYTWYRPLDGWALSPELATVGVVFNDDWKSWNSTGLAILPVALRWEHRTYMENDQYFFWGPAVGFATETNSSGAVVVDSFTVDFTVNFSGLQVGAGVEKNVVSGDLTPLFVLNVSQPLLKALGIDKDYPGTVTQQTTN